MIKGFSKIGDIFVPTTITSLVEKLEPGLYETDSNPMRGDYFSKLEVQDKKLFSFDDAVSNIIIKNIDKFWTLEDKYRRYEMPFKRGILMHGPPGCGKSSIISLLVKSLLKSNGVVIKFNDDIDVFKSCMRALREIQPDLPVIVLMEDLNYILEVCDESEILNLLDGIEKFSNHTVYLATTNYFEELPNNIRNRPVRFDLVVEVKPPSAAVRSQYFLSLLMHGDKIPNLKQWVKDTEGFSFAHLEELFKSVFLFDNDYKQTIARLKQMNSIGDGE